MASSLKNLSSHSDITLDISKKKFAVVVAEWNSEVTESLYSGAVETLLKHGALAENILLREQHEL